VQDRTISTFSRGYQPAFACISTFLKAPYLEDVKQVGGHDVAIVGAPFDMGTTFRPGARWAPQAVRQISKLYDGYNLDMAVDLFEELDIVDVVADVDDSGNAPGTGTSEPGGLSSREMLRFISIVAKEAPLCGMEVVEVSPPYDSGDITSLLSCRSILDVLAVLVAEGKLGRRAR
jgi:arginase family enzyme